MAIDTIALSGKATDTKAGAVVLLADGRLFCIEGLDFWPADLIGKHVAVTGLLKRKKSSLTRKSTRAVRSVKAAPANSLF